VAFTLINSMSSHPAPPRLGWLLGIAAALLASACAGPAPHVKVLGAEQTRAHIGPPVLTVFVEVVNPTGRDLSLSRLEYDLSADRLFARRGSVAVERQIAAGATAVVEIAVPVERNIASRLAGVPYRLAGKLYAHADHMERFWNVEVRGELEASTFAGDHVLRVKLGPSSSR
jgi:hypothetical protein